MDVLQLLGTAAILTLAAVCLILWLPKNYALFIVTGQAVFAWCFFVLVLLFVTRMAGAAFGIDIETIRPLNSLMFIICVVGIVYSVVRKSRKGKI